jgi:RNA polymerase sigma-70 factor (ECF subfamily)
LNLKRDRVRTVPLPDENLLSLEPPSSTNYELAQVVKRAIDILPEKERIALILVKFEGMSCEEAANAMDTTTQAVKSLLWRARENLRKKLVKYLE